MNSFSTHYIVNNSQQELNEKLINLQRQLIETRLQQDNLRRINKSLEETIKTATKNQMKDFNPTQRLSMNMTWKQKYEHEVQRNLESQKYIKVLEKKKSTRNTLSLANHSNSKPKFNTNNRHSSNYSTAVKSTSNHLYEPNTTKCDRNFTLFAQNTHKTHKLVRQNSISKMDNFIDRLLSKDDGRMSQIALNTRKFDINCLTNVKNYSNKKMLTNKRNQDSLDKNFYSVSGLKSNRQQRTENDENAWELIDRKMALKCNLDMYNKKHTFNTEHDKYHKTKLQLTTHYR